MGIQRKKYITEQEQYIVILNSNVILPVPLKDILLRKPWKRQKSTNADVEACPSMEIRRRPRQITKQSHDVEEHLKME